MSNNDNVAGLCARLRTGTGLSEPVGDSGGVIRDAWVHSIMQHAADTLERQAAENKRLRELLRCIRDTPASEFDAVDVANRIRAALTGEDA